MNGITRGIMALAGAPALLAPPVPDSPAGQVMIVPGDAPLADRWALCDGKDGRSNLAVAIKVG